MHGKQVMNICNKNFKGNFRKQVDVSRLPEGIYFVHVEQGGKQWVQRVAVE
ncbi:MAG: T9SS type A sorting domain-containing protein [Bacteroidetes bacterium]|nr:T9SS type A sorting domain-containing protein [Bacteroidota bacterium]